MRSGGGWPLGPLQLAVRDSLRPITLPLGVMNDDVMNGFPLGASNHHQTNERINKKKIN